MFHKITSPESFRTPNQPINVLHDWSSGQGTPECSPRTKYLPVSSGTALQDHPDGGPARFTSMKFATLILAKSQAAFSFATVWCCAKAIPGYTKNNKAAVGPSFIS